MSGSRKAVMHPGDGMPIGALPWKHEAQWKNCQLQKTTYCIIPFIWNIQNRQIWRDGRSVVARDLLRQRRHSSPPSRGVAVLPRCPVAIHMVVILHVSRLLAVEGGSRQLCFPGRTGTQLAGNVSGSLLFSKSLRNQGTWPWWPRLQFGKQCWRLEHRGSCRCRWECLDSPENGPWDPSLSHSPAQGCLLVQGVEWGVLGNCTALETLASQLLDFWSYLMWEKPLHCWPTSRQQQEWRAEMPLSLLASAIPSWAQLGQDRHFKIIMFIEVSFMGRRAKNNHLNGSMIYVQQCTHFRWTVGWVLTDLYTYVNHHSSKDREYCRILIFLTFPYSYFSTYPFATNHHPSNSTQLLTDLLCITLYPQRSYEWDDTMCNVSRLASLAGHNVFAIHPFYCAFQYFIPFLLLNSILFCG